MERWKAGDREGGVEEQRRSFNGNRIHAQLALQWDNGVVVVGRTCGG